MRSLGGEPNPEESAEGALSPWYTRAAIIVVVIVIICEAP